MKAIIAATTLSAVQVDTSLLPDSSCCCISRPFAQDSAGALRPQKNDKTAERKEGPGTWCRAPRIYQPATKPALVMRSLRSEEHTSELQSLMRISYAVFCLTKN